MTQQPFQSLFLAFCTCATPCLGAAADEAAASDESANVAVASTGPDVFVFSLPSATSWGSNTVNNELIAGFSVGTDSCNAGDANLLWIASSDDHPVIRQNLYRLRNNRFEQLGTSWVKHGFFATNENDCSPNCVPFNPGWQLAPDCSDLYSGALNGDRNYLGPSSDVNAFTGEFPWPPSFDPPNVGNINYRLQARHADIDPVVNPGAEFFVDGHYVTRDDAEAGNGENNVSHRAARINTLGQGGCPHTFCLVIETTEPTQAMIPAIYAWQDLDPTVQITEQRVPGEGLFILGAHVADLGDGFWEYEYALYNMNSHRSAASFRVPIPEDAIVRNVGFHDVSYHDLDGVPIGNPPVRRNYEGTDWPSTLDSDSIVWQTTPYETEPNANALRWSTLYNFRFEANAPPSASHADVGLFRPGEPAGISILCQGPVLSYVDCNMNGIDDLCDLNCAGPGCNQQTCGQFEDCNENGVPDDPLCEADCNTNDIPDECDVSSGTSMDCNGNVIPDECDAAAFDCNDNEVPDDCDIANGTLTDSNGDGIPDECCPPPCEPDDTLLANNFGTCTGNNANCVVGGPACSSGICDPCGQVRYISFGIPSNAPGESTAIRVKLTSLYDVSPPLPTAGGDPGPALALFEGQYRYLNTIPNTLSRCCDPNSNPTACAPSGAAQACSSDADCTVGPNTTCMKNLCPDSPSLSTYFRCARLGCTPEYRDWGSDFSGLITYATGNAVVPDSTYHAAILAASCAGNEPACPAASVELIVRTERWGNVDCTQAEVPTAADLGLVTAKAKDGVGAIIKPRAQMREADPDPMANVGAQHIARLVDAVKGRHYPDSFPITQCP